MKTRNLLYTLVCAGLVACGPDNNGENNGDNASTNGSPNGMTNGTTNGSPNGMTNGTTNGDPFADIDLENPGRYEFPSRYEGGASSVSYSGQTARHLLIDDLNSFIASMTEQIDSGDFQPGGDGTVVEALDFYYRFDSDAYGDELILVETDPPPAQSTYADVSTGKDLVGKTAGNDDVTDHKDFTTAFTGWADTDIAEYGGGVDTPENLITAFFEQLEENAFARADGVARPGPFGEIADLDVHLTEEGHDLKQLTQKFLLGAVALSQGTDDYLDDDTEGKGLLAPHTRDEDAAYTSLEHQWDEGFGYFGASRGYLEYTDQQIADGETLDLDDDGAIDLLSEYNWGASVNAGKRDVGSATGTDFTTETYEAFWRGRAIIALAEEGELSQEDLDALKAERDAAVEGWEKAIAATVVHYINDTIEETDALGTDDYDFANHAKVWSEMKGFALGFQFNPRSPLTDTQFEELHSLIGDAPELEETNAADYVTDLETARDLMRDAYGFEADDVQGW